MKRALITGVTGQDGSYLAELLLEKGYDVWGSLRRSSSFNTGRIDHIFKDLNLRYADLTDAASIENLIIESKPDEVYNLGAQSRFCVFFHSRILTRRRHGGRDTAYPAVSQTTRAGSQILSGVK